MQPLGTQPAYKQCTYPEIQGQAHSPPPTPSLTSCYPLCLLVTILSSRPRGTLEGTEVENRSGKGTVLPFRWTGINGGEAHPEKSKLGVTDQPGSARPHASEEKLGGRCLEKPECGWRPGRMGTPRAQALPSWHRFLCTPLTQRGLQAGAKGQGLSLSLPGASVGNEDRREGNRGQEPQSGSSACFWKREERPARKGRGWI